MEDKAKREELARHANEYQIGGVWIGIATAYVMLIFSLISSSPDDWVTRAFQGTLAFVGIIVGWLLALAHSRGVKFIESIQDLRYGPVAYLLLLFLDIIWITDWYKEPINWVLTSSVVPHAIVVALVGAILLLIAGIIAVVRSRRSIRTLGVYDDEAAAEFRRLTQQAAENSQAWQKRVEETESQNREIVRKLESERDIYRHWWSRIAEEALRAYGLPETRIEALKNDEVMLGEYSLRALKIEQQNAVQKVVYFDATYKSSLVENLEKARDFFASRGFVVKDASELRNWMRDSIANNTADRCVAVFVQDVVPTTVAEVQNRSCTLRQFLDRGGRVVWRGDIPLYYVGTAGKVYDGWAEKGPSAILGVTYDNFYVSDPQARSGRLWDGEFPVSITDAGNEVGINELKPPCRPVPRQDVTTVYAEIARKVALDPLRLAVPPQVDGYFACCWKKNFDPAHPHSGFMQYYLGRWDGASEEDLEAFLKFSLSSWPLRFPSPWEMR